MIMFPEIYEKIIECIKLKSNIICKLYETFTFDSIKLITKLTKHIKMYIFVNHHLVNYIILKNLLFVMIF